MIRAMSDAKVNEVELPDLDLGDSAEERRRSTIAFPYTPLRDAEAVATQLQNQWPGYASTEQLAASMNQRPTSGTFRTKVATARIFGAVTVARGTVTLTQLGKDIVDPQKRDSTRVQAFLQVPLFGALFEAHKTGLLPANSALEREIIDLGVSEKQADRARQAFQRSAEQAGFFKHGKDRLVQPATELPSNAERRNEPAGPPSSSGALPAALEAAWITLLDNGADWTPDEVVEWVALARRQRALLVKRS